MSAESHKTRLRMCATCGRYQHVDEMTALTVDFATGSVRQWQCAWCVERVNDEIREKRAIEAKVQAELAKARKRAG